MEQKLENEERLVKYLLGELPKEEMLKLEQSYFLDDDLFNELQAVELELIDRYVEGDLSKSQQDKFEHFFLSSPARQEKLRFAEALKKYVPGRTPMLRQSPGRSTFSLIKSFAASPIGAVASIILIVCIGLVVWGVLFYPSAQNRVIGALSNAYREQRYVEARISGLNYAPLSQTRGEGQANIDKKELSRAELIALEEVSENPTALSHHALGQVYLAEQRFDEAISQFEKALEIGPADARIHSDLGAALFEKARSNEDSQKKATEIAESQINLNKALDIDGTYLEALFNRALWYEYMSLPRQAREDWRRYLDLDRSSPWSVEAKKHLDSLEEKNSPRTNSQLFEEFYRAYRENNDETAWNVLRRSRARTGNIINEMLIDEYLSLALEDKADDAGSRLQMLSYAGKLEYETVGDRFTKNLARFYTMTDQSQREILLRARHLMRLAYESYKQTEYDKSIKLYSSAKEQFEQAGDICEAAMAECWTGYCYLRVPKVKQALRIFEHLHPSFAELQYKWLQAQALNAIADAKSSQGQLSKTLEIAEQSIDISESIQDPRGVVRNLQLYVQMHLLYGDYPKAMSFVLSAFELADTFSPQPHEIWTFYQQAASSFYSLGFAPVAIEFQQEALRLAIESGTPGLKSRSYSQLALIWQAVRNFHEAIRCAELALAEAQNIKDEKSKNNSIANSTLHLAHLYRDVEDFNNSVACYDRAIQLHKQMALDIYLFEAHRGKLLSLVGLKDDSAIEEQIKTAVSLLEQDRQKILEESNRNKFFDLAQDIYDIAIDFNLSRAQNKYEAFKYSEASRARSLLDMSSSEAQVINSKSEPELKYRSATQPLGLQDIQKRLPDRSQIVQYSVLNNKVIIWVISKNDIVCKQQQIALDELNERVLKFVNAITQAPRSRHEEIAAEAKSLYELLIGPVESILDERYLIFIVPDKVLNYLPFGALMSPSEKYFVEKYLSQLSPSSSFVIKCSEEARKKKDVQNEDLLCVGDPSFDRKQFPELSRLASASDEARQVAALYNSRPPLIGQYATERRVRAEMPGVNVIHFAGHCVVDKRSPMLSKLLLAASSAEAAGDQASDGFLQASEIYDMKLPKARLAILSACQTGVEKYYRGEGAISIARPFIKAGVPLVVATLWPVETGPTAQLMISFHKYRKHKGASTVEALSYAQRDMINSPDPADRQPRIWASFVLIGGYAEF
jgi:CHAT domain-containing protein